MTKKQEKVKEPTFTKEQVINSKTYIRYKDLLNSVLDKNKEYTIQEIDDIINKFLKGKVM